jgi:hypothetical protein
MICHARLWLERMENNTLTDKDIWELEIFVRLNCPEHEACELALNKFLIKRDEYKKALNDPTKTEETRKARWWKK